MRVRGLLWLVVTRFCFSCCLLLMFCQNGCIHGSVFVCFALLLPFTGSFSFSPFVTLFCFLFSPCCHSLVFDLFLISATPFSIFCIKKQKLLVICPSHQRLKWLRLACLFLLQRFFCIHFQKMKQAWWKGNSSKMLLLFCHSAHLAPMSFHCSYLALSFVLFLLSQQHLFFKKQTTPAWGRLK